MATTTMSENPTSVTPRRTLSSPVAPRTPHPERRYRYPSVSFSAGDGSAYPDDEAIENSFDRSRFEPTSARLDGAHVDASRRNRRRVDGLNEESFELLEEEEISDIHILGPQNYIYTKSLP